MASHNYVNSIIGVVIVLAVLSAMWSTITGFITTITGDGPEGGSRRTDSVLHRPRYCPDDYQRSPQEGQGALTPNQF